MRAAAVMKQAQEEVHHAKEEARRAREQQLLEAREEVLQAANEKNDILRKQLAEAEEAYRLIYARLNHLGIKQPVQQPHAWRGSAAQAKAEEKLGPPPARHEPAARPAARDAFVAQFVPQFAEFTQPPPGAHAPRALLPALRQ